MADRYTKLFSLPENLYTTDCPVMVCAGALSKDNQTNKVLVQLRFQNIDKRYRTIIAIKVSIQPLTITGNSLGVAKEYQYLDVNIERSAEDGSKQPIILDDITTRSFRVSILEVLFDDDSIWEGTEQNWCSLRQSKLSEKYNTDLVEQYKRDTFVKAEYEPFAKDGIWMCACGALNTIEESRCCRCKNEKVKQFTALDHNTLTENLHMHIERERAVQQQVEKEKSKKIKKTSIVCGICGIICLVICCFLAIFLQPEDHMLVGEWSVSDNDATYSMIVRNDNTGELSAIGFEGDRESVEFSWEYIDESQNFLLISPQIYKGELSFLYDSASDALFWDLDPDFCFERVCD